MKKAAIGKMAAWMGAILILAVCSGAVLPVQAAPLTDDQQTAVSQEVPVIISQTTETHIPETLLIAGGVSGICVCAGVFLCVRNCDRHRHLHRRHRLNRRR